jgi:hypothetical protein
MYEFIKVTALYSNAVLTAILPHVSDFAQRAELRTNPIVPSEVILFSCDPRKGEIGGHFYLTNGWHFWFQRGHVDRFETQKSYFSLQDPDRIPEFFGPVNMSAEEALALGQRIISQLKGTGIKDILARRPRISGPIHTADGVVPRYRLEWPRADVGANWAGGLGKEIDVEIDASSKRIQMLSLIVATNFSQPHPKVDIIPEPVPKAKAAQPTGGIRMNPVSPAFSNAFLQVVLPAFSEYARKLELPIELPITMSTIKEGPYTGVYEYSGKAEAQIELTNGCMFRFQHGYVTTFAFLYDTFHSVANTNIHENFIGPINMTAGEVIQLGYETMRKLGYTEKDIPILAKQPFVSKEETAPAKTNGFSRIQLLWDTATEQNPYPLATIYMEVDTTAKTVKSLCIREPKLWRDPPKIDIPMKGEDKSEQ